MKKLIFQDLKNAVNQRLLIGCPVLVNRIDDVHNISTFFSICAFPHVVEDAREMLIELKYLRKVLEISVLLFSKGCIPLHFNLSVLLGPTDAPIVFDSW